MSELYEFRSHDVVQEGRTTFTNIAEIKNWLLERESAEESFIPNALPDEMIVLFLISCENDLDATKNTIKSYFDLKRKSPELHDNRIVETKEMNLLMNVWSIASLPVRTKENYVIHCVKLEDSDPKKCNVIDILRGTLMLVDVSINKKNPPDGLVVILDAGAAGLKHLTKISLDICQKHLSFIQEGMPLKLRRVHYLNANFVLKQFFGLIKYLIKNDVFEKMYFHSSNGVEELHKFYSPECLPKDLEGNLPTLKDLHKLTKQQLMDKQEFWKMEEKLRKNCLKP